MIPTSGKFGNTRCATNDAVEGGRASTGHSALEGRASRPGRSPGGGGVPPPPPPPLPLLQPAVARNAVVVARRDNARPRRSEDRSPPRGDLARHMLWTEKGMRTAARRGA